MSRPEVERARAFLDRADADLAAVRALETVDAVPDEIVGFHAQQAAEKLQSHSAYVNPVPNLVPTSTDLAGARGTEARPKPRFRPHSHLRRPFKTI